MFDIDVSVHIGVGIGIVIHKSFGVFLLLLHIVSTVLFGSMGFLRGWIRAIVVMAVGIGGEDVGFVR